MHVQYHTCSRAGVPGLPVMRHRAQDVRAETERSTGQRVLTVQAQGNLKEGRMGNIRIREGKGSVMGLRAMRPSVGRPYRDGAVNRAHGVHRKSPRECRTRKRSDVSIDARK